jgi:hypothetical protein
MLVKWVRSANHKIHALLVFEHCTASFSTRMLNFFVCMPCLIRSASNQVDLFVSVETVYHSLSSSSLLASFSFSSLLILSINSV